MTELLHTPHLSISQRLHDSLGKLISNTEPGGRLPSEPELARSLGVSRATLREAMRTFETQGMIRRRQGSGTFVTHTSHIIESGLEILESIETLAARIGLPVEMGELDVEIRAAQPDETGALQIPPDSLVTCITRVILAEQRPVAYLIDVLPEQVLSPEALQQDFRGSVLDILLHNGRLSPYLSRTEITAVTASAEVARSLGIQRGDVLLRFVAKLYSHTGLTLDYSTSYFLPGYFRFHVVRRVG